MGARERHSEALSPPLLGNTQAAEKGEVPVLRPRAVLAPGFAARESSDGKAMVGERWWRRKGVLWPLTSLVYSPCLVHGLVLLLLEFVDS